MTAATLQAKRSTRKNNIKPKNMILKFHFFKKSDSSATADNLSCRFGFWMPIQEWQPPLNRRRPTRYLLTKYAAAELVYLLVSSLLTVHKL